MGVALRAVKSFGADPALRSIATRANIPYGYNSGNTDLMSRSAHLARDTVTSIRVVYSNWYVDTGNNTNTWAELGTGTTATVKAGFETAGGAFSQFQFSGITAGSVASGADIISDPLTVSLAPGDKFYIRTSWHNTGGILYAPIKGDATFGDRFEFTATDKTVSGTVANSLPGYVQMPSAIVAMTTKRSGALIGTSRTFGFNDTADGTTGDIGLVARWVGPTMAYGNFGIPADTLVRFLANPTKRANIANTYYTDVFIEHGINDQSRTTVQKQSDFATAWAMFPTKRIHAITVSPSTSGAWTQVNGSDQTILQGTLLVDLNTWLMTLPSPVYAVHDVASIHALVATPTKWKAPGYTDDGLHSLQAANLLLVGALTP